MINFYYQTLINVIVSLKDNDENVQLIAKRIGINWAHLNRVLNTLYLYDLVEIDRSVKPTKFTLTDEGKKIREHFWHIQEIVQKNRTRVLARLHGYDTKDDLMKDIERDTR